MMAAINLCKCKLACSSGLLLLERFGTRVAVMAVVMRSYSGMAVWGMLVVVMGLGCSVLVESQCAGIEPTKLYVCLAAAKADVNPSASCCQTLSAFNSDSGIACLCATAATPTFTSSGAKVQYAILIPKKCNLHYKAGIKCNGVVIPGGQ